MRWQRGHQSPDVVDNRNQPGGVGVPSGTAFGLFRLASMFGWKGILVAGLVLVAVLLCQGGNLGGLVGGPAPGPVSSSATEQERVEFVSFVLDDVQGTWAELLPDYRKAKLVLFRGSTVTGCGQGMAVMGPFYCPLDERAYIDLSFYDELSARFGAPGDFAQAYVLAHEIGHHVQHLLGTDERVQRAGRGAKGAEGASVRLELQADCYAGVWAAEAAERDLLETGDMEEGLRAAAAIGDDRLQKQGQGRVQPDSFTHGTSEQRVRWLRKGYETGNPAACDTFSENVL